MPKIIKEAKEKILEAAKDELSKNSDDVLSMRSIAKKANIAVGTIYHYYPDKLNLIAEILLEDWKKCAKECQENLEKLTDLESSLKCIIDLIFEFTNKNKSIFEKYKGEEYYLCFDKDHKMFFYEIKKMWTVAKSNLKIQTLDFEDNSICEIILFYTRYKVISFDELVSVVTKIIK